jgi:hypothetical protein
MDKQLYIMLVAFLKERGQEISDSPLDELVIPLKDRGKLLIPIILLENAE